jgi:GT2 family glycosyltransferase
MNKGLLSVIIVNWNGKKWLKKCLDSLLAQTYQDTEIVVVDNNSTDDSVEFIKENYGSKIKLIISRKNLGLTRGIEIGISKSKGQFLLLINNDIWVEKNFVEKLVSFYKKNDYSVISPREKRYDKSERFICNTTIDPTGSPAYYKPTYSRPEKIFYLSVCFLCTREVYRESQGLDSDFFMYNEDVDWFWRLRLLGKKFTYTEDIYIYHAGAGSTGVGINYNTFLWRNQNTLQTIIKNYKTSTLLFIIPLFIAQNLFEIFFFILLLKPKISFSYIQGWIYNLRHIGRTLKKRNWVQKRRVVGDLEVLKHMYLGPAKIKMLLNYK